MICIRCRRETRGTTCEFCAKDKASPAPSRATGKQVVPPNPSAGMGLGTKIGLSLLVIGIVAWGAIKLTQNSEPEKTTAAPVAPKVDTPLEAVQRKIGALFGEINEKKNDKGPAAQKRLKEIEAEIDRLAQEAAGKDKAKAQKIIAEAMAKYVPDALEKSRRQNMETLAASRLREIVQAEMTFRTRDPIPRDVPSFWVADISGLARLIDPKSSAPLLLVEAQVGQADAKAAFPLDQEGVFKTSGGSSYRLAKGGTPAACDGYLFQIVESHVDATGATVKYDPGNGRNKDKFAVCAFPAEYGKPCKLTFLSDEKGAIRSKDNGGRPVTTFPKDLDIEGW